MRAPDFSRLRQISMITGEEAAEKEEEVGGGRAEIHDLKGSSIGSGASQQRRDMDTKQESPNLYFTNIRTCCPKNPTFCTNSELL